MALADQQTVLTAFIKARLSERTKVPVDQIDLSSGLIELGLKSIDAVLLCGEVEDEFKIEVDPASIFEHETLGGFVAAVMTRFDGR